MTEGFPALRFLSISFGEYEHDDWTLKELRDTIRWYVGTDFYQPSSEVDRHCHFVEVDDDEVEHEWGYDTPNGGAESFKISDDLLDGILRLLQRSIGNAIYFMLDD